MLTSLYSLYTATVNRRSVIKNSFYHKLQRSHFYSRGGYNKKNSTTVAVTALSFNDYTESLKKLFLGCVNSPRGGGGITQPRKILFEVLYTVQGSAHHKKPQVEGNALKNSENTFNIQPHQITNSNGLSPKLGPLLYVQNPVHFIISFRSCFHRQHSDG